MIGNRLEHKTAIVTGAGSGIGRAIAVRFAAEGAQVGILDVDTGGGTETEQLIRDAGGTAVFLNCNVTDADSIDAALDAVTERFGPLDIGVNNAGISHIGTVTETSEADFDRITEVNVKGVFLCLRAEVQRMLGRGGVLLNISSVAASVALPDRFAYSMSKGAVQIMTLSVACDYVREGIRCNAIAPARIHTPFVDGYLARTYPGQEAEMFDKLSATQPIGRMGKPEEVAALAAYLCSEEAAFLTGTVVSIDGGFVNLKV